MEKNQKALVRKAVVAALGLTIGATLLIGEPALAASNVTGNISGEVVSEAATVPRNATVTVRNKGTGLERSVVVQSDGSFQFPALPIGEYEVILVQSGKTLSRREIVVNVGTGSTVTLFADQNAAQLEAVSVTASRVSPLDIRSTESATILGEQTVDRLPVARDLTSVALLAPGTTKGDSAFGNLASFGGSTVGENVCYINGLNVTNFRDGLGCNSVPFEFYKEFQLKTGGFSAEFGRSTGGVINAVTKSGTNEYRYGMSAYLEPWVDGINGVSPNVYDAQGHIYKDNEDDEQTAYEVNLWASGPIVEDKAFFFVLANPRSEEKDNFDGYNGRFNSEADDDAFYGMKLDWNLTNEHVVELTYFSDKTETRMEAYEYTRSSNVPGANGGMVGDHQAFRVDDSGGTNTILKYTGIVTPDLTVSASYGKSEFNIGLGSAVTQRPLVLVTTDMGVIRTNAPLGAGPFGPDVDEREQIRIDGEYFVGDHEFRFGLDSETRMSRTDVQYAGAETYTSPNPSLAVPNTFAGGMYYYIADWDEDGLRDDIRVRHYGIAGGFDTETSAIYIEDTWQVTDELLLNLGIRSENFNNMNRAGETFVEMTNQIAPRLGFAWDINGDGNDKLFGTWGRYFLPIANNTNVRFSGGETFFQDYWLDWDGSTIADSGAPVVDPSTATYDHSYTYADGSVPDVTSLVDKDLKPMYQDELILGYMRDLDNGWSLGVKGIYRDLVTTIEDAVLIPPAGSSLPPAYAIINPGRPVRLCDDSGCVQYTAEETGQPASERQYGALEFLFERAWDGIWFVKGSYVWSHSWGNNEGYVKSDNGQTDAGITTNFDYAGLMDYSYGNLPNDRRHAFKLFGAWQLTDHWQVGANLLMQSGRPVNAFGIHPTDVDAASYGAASHYLGGRPAPRGSLGSTPFNTQVDLSMKYMMMMGESEAAVSLDIFNLFNSVNATEVNEIAEQGNGDPDPHYGLVEQTQVPRYIRLGFQVDF